MTSQYTVFKNIDNTLALYYEFEGLGCSDYRNADGNGIFLQYIIDEEFIDDDISIDDCLYIFNHREFPIPSYAVIGDEQKDAFIFNVLQHCYKYNNPPSNHYIISKILPKIEAYSVPIFSSNSELQKHDRWNDVLYHLMETTSDHTQIAQYKQYIHYCRDQRWNIDNCNYHQLQNESFRESVFFVKERIRDHEIKCSEDEYSVKYKKKGKIIKNIQKIGIYNDEEINFEDEELKHLCVSFNFNDILIISDLISKIMCVAVNYGKYDVVEHKCFKQIFNHFICYDFEHYLSDKLKFDQYVEAMQVIQRQRFLGSAGYSQRIQRFEEEKERKDDDDEINDDDGICKKRISFNLRATQIYILSLVVMNLKYLSKQQYVNINCNIALNIESPQIVDAEECEDVTAEIDETVDLLNKLMMKSRFNDNMKQDNIAYFTVNNDIINIEFIGRKEKDINISLNDKEYEEDYKNNYLFHIMRVKKLLFNKIGVSIHKFVGDKIKMYWHHNGAILPFTLKDLCCSSWWKLLFNSQENALNERAWNDEIYPYIYLIENIYLNNNIFCNAKDIKYMALIKRLSYHSDLFKSIYNSEYIDYVKYEKNRKCTEITTYKSKYGNNIKYKISKSVIIGLSVDINKKESYLQHHIDNIVSSQIDIGEMIVFNHEKQEKAIFALNLYLNDKLLLYGIMERDYIFFDKIKWILDDYKTAKEILSYFTGLHKLPKINHIENVIKYKKNKPIINIQQIEYKYDIEADDEMSSSESILSHSQSPINININTEQKICDDSDGNSDISLRSGTPFDGQTDDDLSNDDELNKKQSEQKKEVYSRPILHINLWLRGRNIAIQRGPPPQIGSDDSSDLNIDPYNGHYPPLKQ